MMYGYGLNYGMPHFFTLLMWVAIIAIVIALFRRRGFMNGDSCCGHRENRALEILKERYAKGEINKHEFEEKKKDLM